MHISAYSPVTNNAYSVLNPASGHWCWNYAELIRIFAITLACMLPTSVHASGFDSYSSKESIILIGATLIDGTGSSAVSDSVILIQGNIIKTVSKASDIEIPPDVKVINLDGKYIMPGIIDMHVHTTRLKGMFFPLYLYFGVTTVRDTGGDLEILQQLRKLEIRNPATGPRLFFSGPAQEKFRDIDDIKTSIRKLYEGGADFIKIYRQNSPENVAAIVNAAQEFNLYTTADLGPRAEVNWITAEEAAKAGVKGLEHASGLFPLVFRDDVKKEMYDKFDDIFSSRDSWKTTEAPENFKPEMIRMMREGVDPDKYDRLLNLLVKQDIHLVPTLDIFYRQAYYDDVDLDGFPFSLLPEDIRNTWATADMHAWQKSDEIFESTNFFLHFNQKLARDYVAKGGKVLVGTDSPLYYQVPGYDTHKELELLVQGGLTPQQAIRAATIDAATVLNMGEKLGTIETGKIADIIVINRDPVADITATRDLYMIIKEGRIINRESLLPLRPLVGN